MLSIPIFGSWTQVLLHSGHLEGLVNFPAENSNPQARQRAAERVWDELHGTTTRKPQAIADRTRELLSQFFYEETRRKPMVIAVPTKV